MLAAVNRMMPGSSPGMATMTRIVCISDTHDQHEEVKIPEADLLIVAGDFTCHRFPILQNYIRFNEWLGKQPVKHKVVVAGNHDTLFQQQYGAGKSILTNANYLEDEGIELEGLKIWGSPWTPLFGDWAFMKPDKLLKPYWDAIPNDTDILVTHGGPFGTLDRTGNYYGSKSCGSESLAERLKKLKLKLHVFGHIHESFGQQGTSVNAAQCDEMNDLVNQPIVVDIENPLVDRLSS